MTFHFPFQGEDAFSIHNAIMEGELFPVYRNYNPQLKTAAAELLKKNPLFRLTYESCLALPFLPKVDYRPTEREFNFLGIKFQDGIGKCAQNLEEAMRLFRYSADKGDAWAMINYGYGLAHGWIGPENKPKALLYYRKSAQLGNARGMSRYGYALEEGYDGTRDLAEAARWFRMSAEKRDPLGLSNYGISLSKGYEGRKDEVTAMQAFKESADLDNPEGMHNYGYACEKGYSGDLNLPEAFRYYGLAKEKKLSIAQHNYEHFRRKYLDRHIKPHAQSKPSTSKPLQPSPVSSPHRTTTIPGLMQFRPEIPTLRIPKSSK